MARFDTATSPPTAATGAGSGPGGRQVLKNYSFLATCYVVTRFVWFLSIVYLARTLSVSKFGDVNFAQALFTYFTLTTHLGLMTFGTRAIAREPNRFQEHASKILPIRLLLAAMSFVLLVILSLLLPISSDLRLLTVLFGLSLFSGAAILDWAFKGIERMGVVGIMEIFRIVPFVVLVVLGVKGPEHINRIPIFWLAGSAMAAVFGLVMLVRRCGGLRLTLDLGYARNALRQALPLGMAFIFVQVYYLIDTVLLGFLRTSLEVGLYSAAYRMVTFPQGLGGWYFEALFPSLARAHGQEPGQLPRHIMNSTRLTSLVVLPLAVVGTFTAAPAIRMFYGAQYAATTILLQILIWAISVELIGMNFGYALMACGREKDYLMGVILAAASSVALNLILIPRLGGEGAALARAASEFLLAGVLFVRIRRVAAVELGRVLTLPLLGAASMFLCYWISGQWMVGTVLALAAYLAAVLFASEQTRLELRALLGGTT